ncbi:histidine phosphatase family protein [Streptomyces cinnabarinus]|uniref:Histidine phosphatase family protein n=1 Tax=Streptomyces cinnabarinus TaxID=67287 RepID=A0ABY7KF08_9ACTN|nr:histidine phosphatase family protein [Streptomyces cinnabarinus]WAZ21727.1 histidine phosphatase family protein [Streptomyces cinnabarinus]
MTATLLLTRHGQTIWHAENRYAGITDVPLTETGHVQAQSLAHWIYTHPVDAIWTSPLSRAVATAQPACTALALTPHQDHDLRECDFGVVEGRTLAEFEAENPAAAQAFREDPVSNPFPGAEDPRSAAHRGAIALRRIAIAHQGERVLVVAHNTLLRLVLCTLLKIPAQNYRRVLPRLRNTAITEVRMNSEGAAALMSLNVPCE